MRRTPDGRPELAANSEREEILLRLFATYGEPAPARRLESYLEMLEPYPTDALRAASRDWRSRPHKGAPDVGELRAMCEREQSRTGRAAEAMEGGARLDAASRRQQLDEFWAETLLTLDEQKEPFKYAMGLEYIRRRVAGEVDPGASVNALLHTLVSRIRRLPPAGGEP
jgi:hypothetical protein